MLPPGCAGLLNHDITCLEDGSGVKGNVKWISS
jgi:hypothetical protein